MKFGFKKLARGVKKIAKKNRGGVGRLVKKVGPGLAMAAVGATAPTLIVKAASAAKSLGKKVRGIETPKSLAPIVRAAQVRVRKTRSRMPGGAPMPKSPDLLGMDLGRPKVGMASNRRQAKKSLYTTPRVTRRRKKMVEYQTPADMRSQGIKSSPGKTKRRMTKPPTAKQLAAREKFKQMVAARRKKAA